MTFINDAHFTFHGGRVVDLFKETNRKRWDERVHHNAESRFYDLKGFKEGHTSLKRIEIGELGDVSGKSILHLQCHFGMDTISLARMGAEVTGVDFSGEAISLAQSLSEELGIRARFIQSDIYKLNEVLDEEFDIVFTSYGVLCWLPDIARWGEIAASFVAPGGFFYIVENHPFGIMINEHVEDRFQVGYPYFCNEPLRFEGGGTYIDPDQRLENKVSYEWMHTMGGIMNSLIRNGLVIEFLHEFPFGFFPIHPSMREGDDGYWYFKDENFNVPMIFSLKASRPI
jgi:SAM-dependent methyltransferase